MCKGMIKIACIGTGYGRYNQNCNHIDYKRTSQTNSSHKRVGFHILSFLFEI